MSNLPGFIGCSCKVPKIMMSVPTTSAFSQLLDRLDPEPASASAKYEDLRLRIIRILQWKGCPESRADALADITIDRIAEKLSQGEIVENLNAYAAAVVRFVWLEHCRKHKEDGVADLPEIAVTPENAVFDDADERMGCLRRCLMEVAHDDDDRRLIIGYYDTESGDKTKDVRKKLAESLGLSMNALKVRACRLRARLESCINECVMRVTKSEKSNTIRREAM